MTAQDIYDECEIVTPGEAELLFPEADFNYERVMHNRAFGNGEDAPVLVYGVDADGKLHSFTEFKFKDGSTSVGHSREWDGMKWIYTFSRGKF